MNNHEENLKRFIDDAVSLELDKHKIYCKLRSVKGKEIKELERNVYDSVEEPVEKPSLFGHFFFLIIFEIVWVVAIIAIMIIITIFSWFVPTFLDDMLISTAVKIIGISMLIPLLITTISYFSGIANYKRYKREKTEYEQAEDERLKHVNEIIIPKLESEREALEVEYAKYEDTLEQLYDLKVIPKEYCNLEGVCVLQEYMEKYKIIDKKKLLNACDKYFQDMSLESDVQELREELNFVQWSIVESLRETVSSIESETDLIMTDIENQNYDLERLQEQTERDRRITESILYWNLLS